MTPVPVKAGDVCETCGKAITDVRLAAEGITADGSVLKFRTAECLARYMREHRDISAKWVTDYRSGRFVRPESATYVLATIDEATREHAYVAFATLSEAVAYGREQMSNPVDWLYMQRISGEQKSN